MTIVTDISSKLTPHLKEPSAFKTLVLLFIVTLAFVLPGLASVPVIDRDEARYVQASVQMVESGDYVNIRFQDRARNKKPAGVYWLQAGMIKLTTQIGERKLWAQRVPSVFGALLAVFATYWGGLAFLSRRSAFIAALLLATTFSLVFEAHIAKTDALLCGFSALTLAGLLHLRAGAGRAVALLVWATLGLAFMIKGPVIGAILILTLVGLVFFERKNIGLKRLLDPFGLLIFLAITLPWAWMIWHATDGAFFKDAVGGDLGSKLGGAQEKHGGPIGYYLLTTSIFFWPAILLLPAAVTLSFKALQDRLGRTTQDPTSETRAIWLLLAWAIPFFILLELIPTKLPHYTLPLYPALALLCAATFESFSKNPTNYKTSRRIGAVLFGSVWAALAGVVLAAQFTYGPQAYWIIAIFAGSGIAAFLSARALWRSRPQTAIASALASAALIMIPTYAFVLPSLTPLRIADQVSTAFTKEGLLPPRLGGPLLLSPQFTEPSLVYHMGKEIRLGDQVDFTRPEQMMEGTVLILDMRRENSETILLAAQKSASNVGLCLQGFKTIKGFNYSKGDPVELKLSKVSRCEHVN